MSEEIMRCPKCGGMLFQVRQSPYSMLNKDQFNSIKAGDYYCKNCKGDQGNSGYLFFWERELNKE